MASELHGDPLNYNNSKTNRVVVPCVQAKSILPQCKSIPHALKRAPRSNERDIVLKIVVEVYENDKAQQNGDHRRPETKIDRALLKYPDIMCL